MAQRSDQPSSVSTKDDVRPDDVDVVTDDLDLAMGIEQKPPPADSSKKQAAAPDDKDDGSPNDQDSATGDDDKQQQQQQGAKPSKLQKLGKRVTRLTKSLGEAERANQTLQQQIRDQQALIDSLQSAPAKGDDDPPPEPKLEDFKTPQDFARAYSRWEAKTKAPPKRQQKPANTDTKPPPPDPAVASEIQAWQEKGQELRGDEFMEALQAKVQVDREMGEFMLDNDHGVDIYIHLANNPDEATKIYNSTPYRKGRLLEGLAKKAAAGELDVLGDGELKIEGDDDDDGDDDQKQGKKPAGKAQTRKVSKAPPPPDDQEGSTTSGEVDLDALPIDDYMARAAAREKAKRENFR